MEFATAQRIQRTHRCAGCYGYLTIGFVNGFELYCVSCGNGRGFVSAHYVERKLTESRADSAEATQTLVKCGILPEPPKLSEEEILKSLGY
jgi:hypothetical protein